MKIFKNDQFESKATFKCIKVLRIVKRSIAGNEFDLIRIADSDGTNSRTVKADSIRRRYYQI